MADEFSNAPIRLQKKHDRPLHHSRVAWINILTGQGGEMKWTPRINVKDDAIDNADKKISCIKQSSVFYLKFNREERNERHSENRNSVLQATLSSPS